MSPEIRPEMDSNESRATLEPKRILVPLSLGADCPSLLRQAATLAAEHKAELLLVHVLAPVWVMGSGIIPMLTPFSVMPDRDAARAENEIRELAEKLIPADITWTPVVAEGGLTEAILTQARELGADMIILAKHKGGAGLHRLFGTGIAEQLVRNAPCPVLAVPIPTT